MNSQKITDSTERKLRTLLIIFFPVFFISFLVTGIVYYKSYVDGLVGGISINIILLLIMIGVLLVPPFFAHFNKRRMPTSLVVFLLVVLFALWEIDFDTFAPMIFPIIVDFFILVYTNSRPRASNS